jgi:phosphatidylserine/phosphatidylglycerophosphate/cardiolipin synthase-like enzyme
MARNGSDDALRRSTTGVEAVEGLLAYAQTQRPRARGLRSAERAVSMSRALVARDVEHTPLLVRALRTAARLHLRRRRPADALPPAEESVALARGAGGAPLVMSLACLADVYEALQRYGEAATTMTEATQHTPPP